MAKELQKAIGNFLTGMQEREFPGCFTEKEFKSWSKHEQEIHTQPIRGFVCRDCTPLHQKRMAAENRCLNPNINLEKIAD